MFASFFSHHQDVQYRILVLRTSYLIVPRQGTEILYSYEHNWCTAVLRYSVQYGSLLSTGGTTAVAVILHKRNERHVTTQGTPEQSKTTTVTSSNIEALQHQCNQYKSSISEAVALSWGTAVNWRLTSGSHPRPLRTLCCEVCCWKQVISTW